MKGIKVEEIKEKAIEILQSFDCRQLSWVGVYNYTVQHGSGEDQISGVVAIGDNEHSITCRQCQRQPLEYYMPRIADGLRNVLMLAHGQENNLGTGWLMPILASHTIYLRDEEARKELDRQKQLAKDALGPWNELLTALYTRTTEVMALVGGVSFQEFLNQPLQQHQLVANKFFGILNDVANLPPNYKDPMDELWSLRSLHESWAISSAKGIRRTILLHEIVVRSPTNMYLEEPYKRKT